MPSPCYCRGTLILTERGEVPVEELRVGDTVVTRSGTPKPIKWIGRRRYTDRFLAGNKDVLPIRIDAGALANDIPARDLWVSPEHALYLGEALVTARHLVNGLSIVQVEDVESVEYFHIELPEHDVIVAEGAFAETFIDDGSRVIFDNASDFLRLYREASYVPASCCAPRIEDEPTLAALRRELEDRARRLVAAPAVEGYVDAVSRDVIEGWAFDRAHPERRLTVVILDHGEEIARVVADRYRQDLEDSGVDDGGHSFSYQIPGGLAADTAHTIAVHSEIGWVPLIGSPIMLEADNAERSPASAAPDTLRGSLDLASHTRIAGWAQDLADAERPVLLVITVNGRVMGRVLANRYRDDLAAAGFGSGRHAFELVVARPLSVIETQEIHVMREVDGAELPNSPMVLPAANQFDTALEAGIGGLLEQLRTPDDEERALGFLAGQMDRLLARRADREGGRPEREAYRLHRRRWGPVADQAMAAGPPSPRALVIDDRVPNATRDGGSMAILSHMRALGALGYEVSFVAASDMRGDGAALIAEGISVCGAPLYSCVEEVLVRQAGTFDIIYLHRIGNAERYLMLARRYCPKARIIYSVADLHHLRLRRQAGAEQRPELLALAQLTEFAEILAARRAHVVVTHSPAEAELLRRHVHPGRVHVVPFAVLPGTPRRPFAARDGIAFLGSFEHSPNPDAVHYLVQTVLPLVWKANPALTCKIVGHGWSQARLPRVDPRVSVLGGVDDLDTVFDTVRLTVAPQRFGAGIKAKVLDSFAAGLPCVMTSIAAEGLPLTEPLKTLVGDTPAALADRILHLHADPFANEALGREAVRLVTETYDAERVREAFAVALGGKPAEGTVP